MGVCTPCGMRRADPPYTLAYVTLEEGPTMLTGQPVPTFTPA